MNNLSAEKMLPFALAVAEADHVRAMRLNQLKEVRRHERTETAEKLAVVRGAYSSAKRNARAALAAYVRARDKIASGEEPGRIDEDTAARLQMHGWNV